MTRSCTLLFVLALSACPSPLRAAEPMTLASPDGRLRLTFRLDDRGRPEFDVAYRDTSVATGSLGLRFAGSGPLREGLKVAATRRGSRDETYAIPVGKASSAGDRHNELVVTLEEAAPPRRRLDVAFRAFDDGVAFRYLIPAPGRDAGFVLTDELTRLSFPGDPTAYALPLKGYTTPYENYCKVSVTSGLRPQPPGRL